MSNITFAEYRDELVEMAADILDDIEEYGCDAYDQAHERVDGHQWIIYYAYNDDVLKHASNPDAWEDCYAAVDIGNLVVERGMDGARVVQAYFAMLEDLNAELYALADSRDLDLD